MEQKNDNQLIIQRPPKIYLDTNHLIYITKVRKGEKLPEGLSEKEYKHLDEYIKTCGGLIFNPYAALEWVEGNATIGSAREIAAVVDTSRVKYVIDADYITYTYEILNQYYKNNVDINIPDLPPILQNISDNKTYISAYGILIDQVPDYAYNKKIDEFKKKGGIPITIEYPSAQDWTERSFHWKKEYIDIYQERIHGFKASFLDDIQHKDEYFMDPKRYREEWLKRFLKIDKILEAFNPGIDTTDILDKIDIQYCPAVSLYWTIREKKIRSGNPPKDNDIDDYSYIHTIPYADIVLIEKKLHDFVLQADNKFKTKVFSKVSKVLEILGI